MVVPQDADAARSLRPTRYLAAGSAIDNNRSRHNNTMETPQYSSDGYIIQYVDEEGNDIHDRRDNEEKITYVDFAMVEEDFEFRPKREREECVVTATTREILNMQQSNSSILDTLKEYFSANMKNYVEKCEAAVEMSFKKYTRKIVITNGKTNAQSPNMSNSASGYVSKYKNIDDSFNEDDLSTSVSISDSDVRDDSFTSNIVINSDQNATKKYTKKVNVNAKLESRTNDPLLSDSDSSCKIRRYTRKTVSNNLLSNDSHSSSNARHGALSDSCLTVNDKVSESRNISTKRYTRKILADNKMSAHKGPVGRESLSDFEGSSTPVTFSGVDIKKKFLNKVLTTSNSSQDKDSNVVSKTEHVSDRTISNLKHSFHRKFLTSDDCSEKTSPDVNDFKKDIVEECSKSEEDTKDKDGSQCFSDFYKKKLGRM